MKTVKQVSIITGLSVRTLHHYDSIGLLPPSKVSDAGYRLYDEAALRRLQTIMLFRELEMPLKQIKALLNSPYFDAMAAIRDQRELLKLKAQRLSKLIELTEKLIEGDETMDFSAFDNKMIEDYEKEARQRWGGTSAYSEFEKKDGGRSDEARKDAAEGLMRVFERFGRIKDSGKAEDNESAQEAVKALKAYISENYYTCTDEILAGLGEMYVADERFKANIDERCGQGTAAFARGAIKAYIAASK